MIEAGEDPRFIARRLVISASEDIGMGDPLAIVIADAAARAVEFVGFPEAAINLAQATVHLALAPKSNASYMGLNRALDDVRNKPVGEVPKHLRDASYRASARLGHGKGYQLPARRTDGVGRPAVPPRRPGRRRVLPTDAPRRRGPAGRPVAGAPGRGDPR